MEFLPLSQVLGRLNILNYIYGEFSRYIKRKLNGLKMSNVKNVLLMGGGGNLGSEIIKSKIFKNIYAPSKNTLNLLDQKKIRKILETKKFNLVINCASLARMEYCEKNIGKAIENNIKGTFNLVKEILNYEQKYKKKIKIIHISSDAVYPSTRGNYKEGSSLGPYNVYGWTKLASEFLIKMVEHHVIIRTRFYKKNLIKYKFSASDIYTSQIEIEHLPRYISYLIKDNYNGIVNVGSKRKSDFKIYKNIKKNLKSFKRKDLIKRLKFNIARDSSLNLSKFNKIKSRYE